MFWSKYFLPTLKEDPQEAEAASHKLMMRSGMIRRLTAGAYSYLPLGLRTLKKVKRIIREEMDAESAQELLLPALHPAEIWEKTGRYEQMGEVLISFKNRHERNMVLGPTHEEIITDLVASELRSYKELPYTLYQIQTKFRDEVRARFGVVRSCEFIMKDAYSFDKDQEGLKASYEKMYGAYCRIFSRCGLDCIPVMADSGVMGGNVSHEFMVPSEIGEDKIAKCNACSWAASNEIAECAAGGVSIERDIEKLEEKITPNVKSVEEVSSFLSVTPRELIKTLIFIADGKNVAILIRGDHEANEVKIKRQLGAEELFLADDAAVKRITGGEVGFSGPVGLKNVNIYADHSVKGINNAVTGANKKDAHLVNVNAGRDYKVDKWIDAREITSEDACPECGSAITVTNCIEIGHTFNLGKKYSEILGAKYLDESGKENFVEMGCYGIGVNRILAAVLETSHDKDGIIWPLEIAPFQVVVLPLKTGDKDLLSNANRIYEALEERGIEVMLDDRDNSPGVKFKDADLVGFPVQVIVGKKTLAQGKLEVKIRQSGEKRLFDISTAHEKIVDLLSEISG